MKIFEVMDGQGRKLHVLARTREDAMEIGLDWASKNDSELGEKTSRTKATATLTIR